MLVGVVSMLLSWLSIEAAVTLLSLVTGGLPPSAFLSTSIVSSDVVNPEVSLLLPRYMEGGRELAEVDLSVLPGSNLLRSAVEVFAGFVAMMDSAVTFAKAADLCTRGHVPYQLRCCAFR